MNHAFFGAIFSWMRRLLVLPSAFDAIEGLVEHGREDVDVGSGYTEHVEKVEGDAFVSSGRPPMRTGY